MHIRPNNKQLNAEAPEIIVRVQPNSIRNDSKKTPKVAHMPHIIIMIMKLAITMNLTSAPAV